MRHLAPFLRAFVNVLPFSPQLRRKRGAMLKSHYLYAAAAGVTQK
jgi:hypothetical protein